MPRKKPYSRREFNESYREWARERATDLVKFVLICVAIGTAFTAYVLTTVEPGGFRGYVLGGSHVAFIGALVLTPRLLFLVHAPRAIHHVRGAWGEDFTREEIAWAKRRKLVWGSVDSLETARGDVDHLVVTRRGGVLAIDSKWRSTRDPSQTRMNAASATKAAGQARSVLRSRGLLDRDRAARHRLDADTVTVRPVVVIWGSMQKEVTPGLTVDGVPVVAGSELRAWLRSLDGETTDEDVAQDILDRLRAFQDSVRPQR